jgi:hypothetical protein
MSTTSTNLDPAKKVTLLKHLAAGKGLDIVATIVGLKRDQILDIASRHGYPDKEKLAWAVDVLEKKLDDEQAELPDRTSEVRREERAATPRPAAVPTPSAAPAVVGALEDLIATGKGHESRRIQAAANKVLDDLDRLRTLIRDDQKKHAARRKAEREKAEARAEVERLEAQLAEAKAKLRGGTPAPKKAPAPADGPSAAEVRAWAAANDVSCPAVGRVPSAVREAFDEAHLREAS